ncbi:DNA-binding GntR family transcriptional regulator [Roseiarcus fermentans]|uniref:DNA-binding GntR family transcriptional regulator n=1 Tax=Roseiarcus fermentans TaxID=1473586 RepID=A0A366FHW8_9HYPH|nr:GntR family transcriptional regulator [Roseiarcus fermentans]RBP14263.1 DNA-binding GntR family transcriptional regulator [Roseiarcus fermentans]
MAKGAHSKADAVYGELKRAILTGALEPGSLIEKAELCEKFNVSRYPVSAAVSRLAYDQLVDVAPQHGSFVSRISLNDVRERLFIRSALEGEIAAEAARRMTPADTEALSANLTEAEAAVDAEDRAAFYGADVAFHQILTARLAMARAGEVLDGLRVHLERVRRILMAPPGRIREALAEHRAVARAIEAGDAAAARDAMTRHLGVTAELLERVAQERPGIFAA